MIFTAQKADLERLWAHARPFIERFSDETMVVSAEDLYRDISAGEKQLWLIEEGARVTAVVVTQVYSTRKGSICCVWAACGNSGIGLLLDALAEIEKWARSIGCVALEIRGRKGWERVLPEFAKTGVLLEKDLRKVH